MPIPLATPRCELGNGGPPPPSHPTILNHLHTRTYPGSGVAGGGGREAREAGGVARAGERREPSRLLEKATDEAPNLAMFEGKSGTNPGVSE